MGKHELKPTLARVAEDARKCLQACREELERREDADAEDEEAQP